MTLVYKTSDISAKPQRPQLIADIWNYELHAYLVCFIVLNVRNEIKSNPSFVFPAEYIKHRIHVPCCALAR